VIHDIRYAVRMLSRSKAWTAVVVLSLALGTGANTALFSAVNGLLLRKLPVEDPDGLVRLRSVGQNDMANSTSDYGSSTPEDGRQVRTTFSYPMFQELRNANKTVTDLVAGAPMGTVHLVIDGQAEIVSGYIASGNYHGLLGATTVLGRTIVPDDDRADAPPVVVLSQGFWGRRFGRDPAVLGRVVQANGTPVTIVGILSREFTGVQRAIAAAPDLSFPLALDPRLNAQEAAGFPGAPPRLTQPTYWWLQIMGRLKPGITAPQVEGNLAGVFEQAARQGMNDHLARLGPGERATSRNQSRTATPRLRVSSGARGVYDSSPSELRAVTLLSGVVGLILLIVCANVANLLLARVAARQKEISVRMALGATRVRLVRQLLTESVLLAVAGGAFGLVLAYWGKQLLPGAAGEAPLDWRVLLFASALALFTGMLCGIAPALRMTDTNVNAALKVTSRALTGSRTRLASALVVLQVAASLVLLIGAGLFLRTVDNLRRVDVGFNVQNLVLFRLNPRLNGYEPSRIATLYDRMVQRLQAAPGITGVTLSDPPLLSGNVSGTSFFVQGRATAPGQDRDINRVRIAPNFFETLQIPLVAGRAFMARDDQAAPKVAIINEAAARRFFPDENPLGRRFGSSPEDSGQTEIVGLVRDAKYNSVRDPAPPTLYVPHLQSPVGAMAFEVRTAGDPRQAIGPIREAVRQVDPSVPLMNVSTQVDQIERRFSQERVVARAYALFGGLALLVASVGLFGLMSYVVTRRTHEIGIRIALGAERFDVVRMIMGESLWLVASGVAIGLGIALAASRIVASLLFGLAPTDLSTIALAIGVLLSVSACAGYLPARRASRVDPLVALRYE
jgi:predicted permease